MSLDRASLQAAVADHGRVARVVLVSVDGSSPREVGASMVVWVERPAGRVGQAGTIGGGALEFTASERARRCIETGTDRVDREALGPDLGQCCGGSVRVLIEVLDAARLDEWTNGPAADMLIARPLPGRDDSMPLAVKRLLAAARSKGVVPETGVVDGWFVEPVAQPTRPLWVFGAGHVGRAVVEVLAPLPGFALTWVDTDASRFPERIADGVTKLIAPNPADVVRYSPPDAEHLVLTYSHAMDLDVCHALLGHGFRGAGLIGSRTKWARFRNRLRELGHDESSIARIRCPIGQTELGKHPQAIAIGVAAELLRDAMAVPGEGADSSLRVAE